MHSRHISHGFLTPHDDTPTREPHHFASHLLLSINRAILLAVILIWSAPLLCAQPPSRLDTKTLPTDIPVESNLGVDDPHVYEIALNSDEFFQVRVIQLGVDVLLRLLDAGGREVAQMNSPNKFQSEETLTFVAPASGSYRLYVSTLNAKSQPGKYTILREAPRTATLRDHRRVEVERIFVEAMTARAQDGHEQTAIKKFEEALVGWQEFGDAQMTDLSRRLVFKSKAYASFIKARALIMKNGQEAIKHFEEARGFYHEIGETTNEGASLLGMHQAALGLNDEKTGIEFLKQAFPLFMKPEEKSVRANILIEITKYYIYRVKDDNSALVYSLLLYPIYVDIPQLKEAAITANTIGALYHRLNDNEKAYEYLHKALQLRKYFGDTCSELEMLTNLGQVSLELGLKAEALRLLRDEAPPLYKTAGGCAANRPSALNNLGKTYYDLGDFQQARNSYLEALETGSDDGFKAIVNNNLGAVHYSMGEYQESLGYYGKAFTLYKDDVKAQATTQTNLGVVNAARGYYRAALTTLEDALKMRQKAGDISGEAITLTRLSEVYLKLGNTRAALERSNRALTLFGAVSSQSGEAVAFANAMNVSRSQGNRRLAIFYGKRAVNKFQELRGAARGIEGELQKNYLRIVKGSYQRLAELLVEEGQFEQAIQVLNLHQDQQFFDFNIDLSAPVQRAYLSTREAALANRHETQSKKLRQLQLQIEELKRRIVNGQTNASAVENPRKLQDEFAAATATFAAMLIDTAKELSDRAGDENKNTSVEEITEVRKAVGNLGATPGQKAVALYTLAGEDNFYVLLLTHGSVKAFSHPTKAGVMNDKVKEFLTVLRCPDLDPFQESAALYNIMFKSVSAEDKRTTLEVELEKDRPDLLLWSLGNPLDSVPMAALYDARRKQFLVERYQHAVFTRAHPDRIVREPKALSNGLGLGVSKGYTGYAPLPGVKKSLSVIFGDAATGQKGIMNGLVLMDDEFKKSTLESLNGKWSLVHIASHFAYYPGNSEDTALLLGNGDKFSLSKMRERKTLFAGVELLMLSACKTSVKQSNVFGKEIDGFAELAQRLGANSVIATLWNISDADAPGYEIGFYRLYHQHQDWAKSELLRQSQLNLLTGKVTREPGVEPRPAARARRENEREGCTAAAGKPRKHFTPNPKAPLAHPYYWAPYVLYGGSR